VSTETEPRTFEVDVLATVRVTVSDPDVIERVTGPGGDEWRAQMYPLRTRDDVLGMLAENCARRGVERVNLLDGWADLGPGAATMEQVGFGDVERVREVKAVAS
jgi:hypothetical protein